MAKKEDPYVVTNQPVAYNSVTGEPELFIKRVDDAALAGTFDASAQKTGLDHTPGRPHVDGTPYTAEKIRRLTGYDQSPALQGAVRTLEAISPKPPAAEQRRDSLAHSRRARLGLGTNGVPA